MKREDEITEVLELITQIDAYGRGTEEWKEWNGGHIPYAFYIELKDGTAFYVGTDGIIDGWHYKVHSGWMLNEKIRQLYGSLHNRYTVPYVNVQQKVWLEFVEGSLKDTEATFIIHNDSYYNIYIDGEFDLFTGIMPERYTVNKENARIVEPRSQYEITLNWAEKNDGTFGGENEIALYYITERAGFGAFAVCK